MGTTIWHISFRSSRVCIRDDWYVVSDSVFITWLFLCHLKVTTDPFIKFLLFPWILYGIRCCRNNVFWGEFCKSTNRWRRRTFCRIVSSGFWNKVFFFSRFIWIHFIYSPTWKLPKAFSRSFSISGPAGFSFWLQIPFRCSKSYTRSSQFSKTQLGSCSGSLPQCYLISSAAGTLFLKF